MWEFHSIFIYWKEHATNARKTLKLLSLCLKTHSLSLFLSLCPINTNSPTNRDSTTISCPPSQTKQNTKQRATTTSPTPTTPTTTTTTTTQQSPQHQFNQTKNPKKKKKKMTTQNIYNPATQPQTPKSEPPPPYSHPHSHTLTLTRPHTPTHPP